MMSIICSPETKHKDGSSSFHNPTLRSFLSDMQIFSSNPFTSENLMSSFREYSQLLYLSKYTLGFKPKSSSQGRFQPMNANRITQPFLPPLVFLQQEIFSVEIFLHIARFCHPCNSLTASSAQSYVILHCSQVLSFSKHFGILNPSQHLLLRVQQTDAIILFNTDSIHRKDLPFNENSFKQYNEVKILYSH